MSFKIIVDSCCELPEEYKNDERVQVIPFTIRIGDEEFIDDGSIDQATLLTKIAECPTVAKSACPSPDQYIEAFEGDATDYYVVTISSKLSGSHNSAELAKRLYLDENPDVKKNIFIIDSKSAACGETQLAVRAFEWAKEGRGFDDISNELTRVRDGIQTYFILDNLDSLRKNGRMSKVKALAASTLNIKPILVDKDGEIEQRGQGIGFKKTLLKMIGMIIDDRKADAGEKVFDRYLMITHCNSKEKSELALSMLEEKTPYIKAMEFSATGLSTVYENDGGIIITI